MENVTGECLTLLDLNTQCDSLLRLSWPWEVIITNFFRIITNWIKTRFLFIKLKTDFFKILKKFSSDNIWLRGGLDLKLSCEGHWNIGDSALKHKKLLRKLLNGLWDLNNKRKTNFWFDYDQNYDKSIFEFKI